ncbi:DUF4268 domain-containing protein [Capnocytophaga sp. ARDL2]|uniref:DUF4268 domain-containing protein n=1 Tax=Capnocytophaga sp. ARDL2 TaxID=3238809 RepID=UPI0035576FEE
MYSKEEVRLLKKKFWTDFASAYPKKWLLFDTKIKDFAFKFYVDNKKAQVALEIEPKDENLRKIYYEKIESLRTLLWENHVPDAILERNYHLDNGKCISRIWVEMPNVSLHKPDTWKQIFDFFYKEMTNFEEFYEEYSDYIKDLELNT